MTTQDQINFLKDEELVALALENQEYFVFIMDRYMTLKICCLNIRN